MTTKQLLIFAVINLCFLHAATAYGKDKSDRNEFLLESWSFSRGDSATEWTAVTVPHDWAISGPFYEKNDLQNVAITQNFETKKSQKTGRTGGLPYMGVGRYRTVLNVPDFSPNKTVTLLFDGAMSEARVYVNGKEACFWPYGYNSFHCDVTSFLTANGLNNTLEVRLENQTESSRWYPGAGLYRNVHVIVTNSTHVPVWGTYITTPNVTQEEATVVLKAEVKGDFDKIETVVYDAKHKKVGKMKNVEQQVQTLVVKKPKLWSPESPTLYYAVTEVFKAGKVVDTYTTRFGIRSIELNKQGFFLNGVKRKFQGVCNHHDLGPLGTAINRAALRRQLTLLKDMGCDAIRTSHNMPAPELVELCDEMGFMMMVEPFDEWDIAKCKNGYHRFFNEWAEKDMVNMLHNYRNCPSVVMWSIGNEVPTQCSEEGYKVASFLQNICHREDPTRPVTAGMDQVSCVLKNGFAALLDVVGLNYRVPRYQEAFEKLPQKIVLGSETASTVSSRGVYKLPAQKKADARYPDQQCSSYDLEYCRWSNLPEEDFAMADDKEWTIGQFVWTGFDYLGEPSPYDGSWPNHSSMFGIIDLASIPKDRYYLYRSIWRPDVETLHILPHWNWEDNTGDTVPVFVYTNYPSAELFINGKSYGKRTKNDSTLLTRYRLMWYNTVYEAGEVKVVAYDKNGKAVAEKFMRTAGEPHHLLLTPDHTQLSADGKDLAYVNVQVVDKDGNLCPHDGRLIHFSVEGAGSYRAAANGDATCCDLFHLPQMHAFNGQLTALVQADDKGGKVTLKVTADGLQEGFLTLKVNKGK